MKKVLILIFLTLSIIKADLLDDKIKNLVGDSNYIKHRNLINILFANKSNFYNGSDLNVYAILEQLIGNGLITLDLKTPTKLDIDFVFKGNGVKSLKLLNNTLRNLGYYYYFTQGLSKNTSEETTWTISMNSQYIINPFTLASELKKDEIKIFDVIRENNSKWIYKIDTNFANISQSIFVNDNEQVVLQKPLKPYILKTNGANEIEVVSKFQNNWYPNIVFYDENLEILGVCKENKAYGKFSTAVPQNTKYIKLSDLFTLNNIKSGLSVTLKE